MPCKLNYQNIVFTALLLCLSNLLYGQHVVVIRTGDFNHSNEISLVDSIWYFHEGESLLVNTAGWDTLNNTSFGSENSPKKWHGEGWFGIWLSAAPNLVNKKLSLRINHDGASEFYLDDEPIGGYGKLGGSAATMEAIRAPREVIPLWLRDTHPHLLRIHYANFKNTFSDFYGFQVDIGEYSSVSQRMRVSNQLFDSVPWFASAQLILGLLQFFFFLFYPKRKINLYYALFVLLVGLNGIAIYLYYQTSYPSVQLVADIMTYTFKVLILWSAVTLLYALKDERLPRRRMIALSIIEAFYLVTYAIRSIWFPVSDWDDHFSVVFAICIADGGWFAYQVIRTKKKGVWLVGVGVASVIILYFFAWADVFNLWPYYLSPERIFVLSAGELILPICLSLYLAVDFAATNQNLLALSGITIAQETEKRERIAGEAKRLENLVMLRTTELQEKAEELKALDAIKSRFFTNLTHEFRTPLTLIINPAREMTKNAADEQQMQYLQLILQNATRLLGLINQLLDLSKLENGLMDIKNEPFELVALINAHIQSYQSLAIQKQNQLRFSSDCTDLWMLGDSGKLDMIILNLLSNALKFTEDGKIEVFLQAGIADAPQTFALTVRDTGSGIPAEQLPYIFERFYQVDPSDTRSAEGTGIGLALVKELVELLEGQIHVKSVEGLFTEFEIKLPYQPTGAILSPVYDDVAQSLLLYQEPEDTQDDKPLVLVVEDHHELRHFIQSSLSDKYHILTAKDGAEGISLALKHIPNLVITDLMMPNVDGYQLTDTLKTDKKTSHIPVIMLTAKSGTDNRIQGITTGADAYLEKPFDQQELFALIDNLMKLRAQLRERYGRQDQWFKDSLILPSIEQDFIAMIRKSVESNIADEGYNAASLAADMGLSRTQLHRKLKDLIGQAPGELIRTIRLQYAHDLLQRQIATIAEVAYMVGFSNPASFSASFSRHFGFPPKEVKQA